MKEPMFIEAFSPATKLEILSNLSKDKTNKNSTDNKDSKGGKDAGTYVFARFSGAGFRPDAEISINDLPVGETKKEKEERDKVTRLDKNQCTDRPFVEQESTHSYRLCFKPPTGDWKIRYRQRTLQGFEENEIKQVMTTSFDYKLRHFRPGNPAEVDLTFTIPDKIADPKNDLKITLDDPRVPYVKARRGCEPPDRESDNSFRVKCLVPAGSGGRSERDFISVKVFTSTVADKQEKADPKGAKATQKKDTPTEVKQTNGKNKKKQDEEKDEQEQKKAEKTRFVDIPLPVRPQILSLKNLLTGKASGFANDDATVIINGTNLQHVTGVLFGDKEAQITVPADLASLTVKIPRAEVPKGQKSAVPVVLRTDSGLLVSAGAYTYVGEPLPKAAVLPYPVPWRP